MPSKSPEYVIRMLSRQHLQIVCGPVHGLTALSDESRRHSWTRITCPG